MNWYNLWLRFEPMDILNIFVKVKTSSIRLYPNCQIVNIIVLIIPATSPSSEKVFLKAGEIDIKKETE